MNTTLARRKAKKLASQLPTPPRMGLWGLLLFGLAVFIGIKILPEARRYWRIRRM